MTEPNKPEDAPPGAGQTDGKRPDDDTLEGAAQSDPDNAAATASDPGSEAKPEPDPEPEPEPEPEPDPEAAGGEADLRREAAGAEDEAVKPDELAAEEPAVIGDPDAPEARPDDATPTGETAGEGDDALAGGEAGRRDQPEGAEPPDDAEAQPGEGVAAHDPRHGAQETDEAPGTADEAALASEDGARPAGTDETATPEAAAGAMAPAMTAAPAAEKVVVERRGGVIPGFIGGVIAVAGAAFAAPYVLPESLRPVMSLDPVEERLAEQSGEIEAVAGRLDEATAELADAPAQADLEALSDRVAALEDDISARFDELSSQLAALQSRDEELTARIEEAERAPLEDATDPAVVAALESYAREVEALRAEVEAQTEDNQRLIEDAAAATAEARAAAEAEAEAAAERAAGAARQQALVDVQAALDAGQPYSEPLSQLTDMEGPAALASAAESGVPTLAALQDDFAGAAREALDAARRASAGDDPGERALTFLQSQLGVRSLEPREGDSADAILSRAQAAARNGDLTAAVEELLTLPEPALAEMQGWIDRARTRAEATDAADQLAASLATN